MNLQILDRSRKNKLFDLVEGVQPESPKTDEQLQNEIVARLTAAQHVQDKADNKNKNVSSELSAIPVVPEEVSSVEDVPTPTITIVELDKPSSPDVAQEISETKTEPSGDMPLEAYVEVIEGQEITKRKEKLEGETDEVESAA